MRIYANSLLHDPLGGLQAHITCCNVCVCVDVGVVCVYVYVYVCSRVYMFVFVPKRM